MKKDLHICFVTYKDEPSLLHDDQVLADYLSHKNIVVTPAVWDDPKIDWIKYDVIIFRSMWDYFERFNEFNLWLDKLTWLGCTVLNPMPVIKWNQSKKYFDDFAKNGTLLPAYQYCRQNNFTSLTEIIKEKDWQKAVVKPAVSGGSFNTWITTPASSVSDEFRFTKMIQDGDVIVQKFMEEVITEGELSLIYFNKKFSHAILKKAMAGDFRVQTKFGGSVEPVEPSKQILLEAATLLNRIPEPLLYARVDGIVINKSKFYLMELELIEPALSITSNEKACENFYNALVHLVGAEN